MKGGSQEQPAIRAVDTGGHQEQRDPCGIGQQRAFPTLFATIHGTAPGGGNYAGRFQDAITNAHAKQIQTNQPVVLRQHQGVHLRREACLSPRMHPSADGAIRAAGVAMRS